MKSLLGISTVLLMCLVMMASGDKKGKDNEDSMDMEAELNKSPKRVSEGRCSCRDLDNQIEQLEFRLDRMVDLWNDFVDKNRNPYDRQGGVRRPPQGGIGGGRGPYLQDDRMRPPYNRRPGYGGRNAMEDDQGSSTPRRFNF